MATDGESIRISIGDQVRDLSREAAEQLQSKLDDAITSKREFLHTAGEYREDGAYVVSRRSAESAGNTKVFEGFGNLRRLFERLPSEFTADEIGRSGITGSRRHMLVRHFAEHPAFECTVVRRNPLTARKTGPNADPSADGSATAD